MDTLFYPRRLVVVGASRNPRKVGSLILNNILASNYEGELTAVNPHESQIMGVPTVKDVSVLQGPIDVAIIAIPYQVIPDVLEELGKKRCKYVIIISSGYKETGKKGEEREEEVAKIARRYNITLVGPNCLGIINNGASPYAYNGSFALEPQNTGNVSLISQSGALISSALDYGTQTGFGFNKVISIGNQADLDVLDGVKYLAEDDSTDVIALYIEGIRRGEELIQTLLHIQKPVIILKPGTTDAAKAAISSHTGSIAGEERVVQALLEEVNAIQVDSLEELFGTMHLFSHYSYVSGRGVGVVTNAGGVGVISVDELSQSGLELARLQAKTVEALKAELPETASFENPVDVLGDAKEGAYKAATRSLLEEGEVGSVLVIVTPQIMTPIQNIATVLARLKKDCPHKPIIPVFVGGEYVQPAFDKLQGVLPIVRTPSAGVRSLAHLYAYAQSNPNPKLWSYPTRYIKKQSINRIQSLIEAQQTSGAPTLDFDTIAVISEEFDIPIPKFEYITDESELGETWKQFQKPVAMKAVAADVLHRSDSGKVVTNLMKLPEARSFYRENSDQEVIMQQQILDGVEIFVGIKTDRQFGQVIVVGLGGIYAELINDTALGVLPITKPRIWRLLKQTHVYRILKGARGTVYDTQFLVDTIYNIHLFAISFEQKITEIDVNPIIVQEEGGYVVDMKVFLAK